MLNLRYRAPDRYCAGGMAADARPHRQRRNRGELRRDHRRAGARTRTSSRRRSRSSATARSRRARLWSTLPLADGDVLEIVHFVGGGDAGKPADDSWTRRRPQRSLAADRRHRQVQGLRPERRRARGVGAEIVTVAVRRVNVSDPKPADADRLHRSRRRSPTCPTPPAASPPTRRSAPCGWRARRAAGTWSSSKCSAKRARSIPTCARR